MTATFFVKPNGRNWVYFTGSTGTAAACYLNVTTGATGGTPANILGTSSQALDGGYYRVSITYTNALTTIGAVILYLANSTPAFFYTGDGASGMYVGLCQIEALSSSTTYIATTTATASRSADVSSFPITNFTADQFTVAGEFVAPMDAYTTNKYVFDSSFDTNNRVYAYCSGGNIYFAVLTAGTSQFASLSVALTAGQKYKFACVVDAIAVTAKLKVTGVAQATAALAGGSYTAPTAPTALYAGNSAGASQLNSLLSQVHVIDRAWTTTEIANWVG